jgi:hypothetical protein
LSQSFFEDLKSRQLNRISTTKNIVGAFMP